MLEKVIKDVKEKNILKKILGGALIITLTFANVFALGVYWFAEQATYAASADELENQSIATANANIEFDAYFKKDDGSEIHSMSEDIGSKEKILNVALNVKENGYLKDAKIVFNDTNFNISKSVSDEQTISSFNKNAKEISLKQINGGTFVIYEVPIEFARSKETFDLSKLSKENVVKLVGTYVDNGGNEVAIDKEIKLQIDWKGEIEASINEEIVKYVPFTYGDTKGVLVQYEISVGLGERSEAKGALPIKSINVEMDVPTFNNNKPISGTVVKNGKLFNTFDSLTEKLNINEENNPTNNIVKMNYSQETYIVTYIYGEEAYDSINESPIEMKSKISGTVKAYNNLNEENPLTSVAEVEKSISLKEQIGNVVEFDVNVSTYINKGYLYSNFENGEERVTEFSTSWEIEIADKDLVEGVSLKDVEDKFLDSQNKEYSLGNSTYYKETSISENDFNNILGEDGFIKLYNGETLVGTLNKDKLEIKYSSVINNLRIETSKPIAEGTFTINNKKAINKLLNNKYNQETVKTFTNLSTGIEGKTKNIALKDTNTNATIKFSNNIINTQKLNENVEIEVTLHNNSSAYDLYKNPTIRIELPSYINYAQVKNANLMYEQGLQLDTSKITTYENANGNIEVSIPLQGNQVNYNVAETSGTKLILNVDLKTKDFTPNKTENVNLYYTNEKAVNINGTSTMEMKLWGPIEILNKTEIRDSESNNGVISAYGDSRTVKMVVNTLNNLNRDLENVSILGRIPFTGNKNILTGEDLGSTYNVSMQGEISVTKGDVTKYYSSNENATKDLNDPNNGWTTNLPLNQVKSYLVVFNTPVAQGELITLFYDYELPANIGHAQKAYGTATMYYDKEMQVRAFSALAIDSQERLALGIAGLTTVEEQNVKLEIESLVKEGETVHEGQIIKYTVKATNTGTTSLTNANINVQIPDGTTYIVYEEIINEGEMPYTDYNPHAETDINFSLGSLNAGETKTTEFEIKVNKLGNGVSELEIQNLVTLTADELTEDVKAMFTNTVKKASFNVRSYSDALLHKDTISIGKKFRYVIEVTNITASTLNEVEVTDILPEGLKHKGVEILKNIEYDAQYEESTRTVKCILESLEPNNAVEIFIETEVEEVGNNYSIEMNNVGLVKASGIELHKSNEFILFVERPDLSISLISDATNGVVKEGEEIEYTITLKNISNSVAENIVVTSTIPDGMIYEQSNALYENGVITWTVSSLGKDREFSCKMTLVAGELPDGIENTPVVNVAKVKATAMAEKKSNEITTLIEKKDSGVELSNKGSIYGYVWIDANKNGKRDDSTYIPNINVVLVEVTSNGIEVVKDPDTNEIKSAKTDINGKYTFSNIPNGTYRVIFVYDTGACKDKYMPTRLYKATGVNESENSRARILEEIPANITTDGKVAGTADLVVNNGSLVCNLGLEEMPVFDLQLEMFVEKVKVETRDGIKETSYTDKKFAKESIYQKYLDGTTTVYVDYKIVVKNTGEVDGYVRDIVDYLSSGVTVVSTNWLGEGTEVHNKELKDILIKPGEQKEVRITLAKQMTANNVGLIMNATEICEYYNELGLNNRSGTPGNKIMEEKDFSDTQVIIEVATGGAIVYITLTIIAIGVLAAGIYLINKKVLN